MTFAYLPRRPGTSPGPAAATGRPVLTVSELTHRIRLALEGEFGLVLVSGEVSSLRRSGTGHIYLILKDSGAQIAAVIWRSDVPRYPWLRDGVEVVVAGRLKVYEPRGTYDLSVEHLEPKGLGAQHLALEQLKQKLKAEGLLDPRRKRPIPRFPACVGLVTSATGAAVRDILQVFDRRFPKLRIILCPVRVQGDHAAEAVCAALAAANAHGGADVLIVGRGGGSQEELAVFNDERVARAIARSRIPVVSAVGHEIDVTVADLVADLRAPTPTAAAELVTPVLADILADLEAARERLRKGLRRAARVARERVDVLARSYALREPKERLRRLAQRLDEIGARLPREAARRLTAAREQLARTTGKLESLSPLGVLARGYSVTMRDGDGGRPLRDAAEVAPGERLRTRLASGEVLSEVVSG